MDLVFRKNKSLDPLDSFQKPHRYFENMLLRCSFI